MNNKNWGYVHQSFLVNELFYMKDFNVIGKKIGNKILK